MLQQLLLLLLLVCAAHGRGEASAGNSKFASGAVNAEEARVACRAPPGVRLREFAMQRAGAGEYRRAMSCVHYVLATLGGTNPEALFLLGYTHHEAARAAQAGQGEEGETSRGDLHQAARYYAQSLQANPQQPSVAFNLGNTQVALGDYPAADAAYEQAVSLAPGTPRYLLGLATLRTQTLRKDAPAPARDAVLALVDAAAAAVENEENSNSKHAHTQKKLSLMYDLAGDAALSGWKQRPLLSDAQSLAYLRKAESYYTRALATEAGLEVSSEHWLKLGDVHTRLSQRDLSLRAYSAACRVNPEDGMSAKALGGTLLTVGRTNEAAEWLAKAVALLPDNQEAWQYLATARWKQTTHRENCGKDPSGPVCLAREAIHNAYKLQLLADNSHATPEQVMQGAVATKDNRSLHNLYGFVADATGHYAVAAKHFEHTLSIGCEPQNDEDWWTMVHKPLSMLATLYNTLGDLDTRDKWIKRLRAPDMLGPDALGKSLQPFLLLLQPVSAAELRLAAERKGDRMDREAASSLPPFLPRALATSPRPDAHRRLRVAFVSSDLRTHAVGLLSMCLFRNIDRSRVEAWALSNYGVNPTDSVQRIYMDTAEHHETVDGWSARKLAARVRELGIDVLVDMNGHTRDSRLDAFALRAAPVQIEWTQGYVGTSGVREVDYIVADHVTAPAGSSSEAGFSEAVMRLPHSYFLLCHAQSDPGIVREQMQAEEEQQQRKGEGKEGSVEFGDGAWGLGGAQQEHSAKPFVFASFNSNKKNDRPTYRAWSRILARVPNSVLSLSGKPAESTEHVVRHLQQLGVARERITFRKRVGGRTDYLRAIADTADLVLDTHYYNGHSTGADTLWAGVPVLTMPGEAMHARVGAALVTSLGVPELAAGSWDEYVDKAVYWATHPEEFGQLCRKVRRQRVTAPMFDGRRWVRNMEKGLFKAWEAGAARRESSLEQQEQGMAADSVVLPGITVADELPFLAEEPFL